MGLIVILFHLKHTILYCNIYQYFAKRFALFSVNHKNKQTTSGQDKSQVKRRQSTYMNLQYWKTLETKLTTESNSLPSNLALPTHPAPSLPINVMFYVMQCNIHTYTTKNPCKYCFNKIATIFPFNVFFLSCEHFSLNKTAIALHDVVK